MGNLPVYNIFQYVNTQASTAVIMRCWHYMKKYCKRARFKWQAVTDVLNG